MLNHAAEKPRAQRMEPLPASGGLRVCISKGQASLSAVTHPNNIVFKMKAVMIKSGMAGTQLFIHSPTLV